MRNAFILTDEKLKIILDSYTSWCATGEEERSYAREQKKKADNLRNTLLNKNFVSNTPDEVMANQIHEYLKTLEGPVGIKIGKPRVSVSFKSVYMVI
jgi:hypothetical protein